MAQPPPSRRLVRDSFRVGAVASAVSVISLLYYFQSDQILMHGDAVAHINIARRVFDSLTPGPLQLGTVWLPLPHVLMIPFLLSDSMWQSGIGGAIPSMIAYVLGVVGIFRLVRGMLEANTGTQPGARVGAWVAAFAYGANPDLIYTQTTGLTEPLYLAFFIWTLVYFAEFVGNSEKRGEGGKESVASGRALLRCAVCISCAELSRYDGWFLAAAVGLLIAVMALRNWGDQDLRRSAVKFLIAISIAPVLWLGYNAIVYRNLLEFANGQYSAQAIQHRVGAPYPGFHNVGVAVLYFLKAAQLSLAVGNWGRIWLAIAIAASLAAVCFLRKRSVVVTLLLLWTPLAFYTLSIAYGSVILHVPTWWPFATFNQRYGLELLPMFAVTAGVSVAVLASRAGKRRWGAVAICGILILASYGFVWRAKPLCLQEAARLWEIRRGLDTAVEHAVAELRPESMYLMDIGAHVGVMERLGIPLRRVVSVENHRQWKRPVDPEGLWERALADPSQFVDYVIVFDGDQVDQRVNRNGLVLLSEIHASGQANAHIYKTNRALNQSR